MYTYTHTCRHRRRHTHPDAHSVEGLARVGSYCDLMSYFNTMSYAMHRGFPLHLCGDALAICLQNFIVVFFFFYYDKSCQLREKMLFAGLFGCYATFLLQDTRVPDELWMFIATTNPCFSLFSRSVQIHKNFKNGSTGQLAGGTLYL